jgi:putative membrane protein
MKSNPMLVITLTTATLLCPGAVFAQNDVAYMGGQANQPNQSNPAQQSRPQPQYGPQPMASEQDSIGNSGQAPQMVKDKMFLRKAAEGGLAQVQFGQLAAQKGDSEEVKALGQKMVDDHTALNKDLEPVADSIGIKLPTHLNKTNQAEYDKLKGLSGSDFDTEYLTMLVKDHHMDLREFRLESANTQDQTLRDAVMKGQRIIHDHMVMVDKLAKSRGIDIPKHRGSRPAPTSSPAQQ